MRALLRLLVPVVAGVLLVPAVATAHPLGNFTINTSAAIVLSPGHVRIEYVVDLAEIPTVQTRPDLDVDGDGTVTTSERSAWARATAASLLNGLDLSIDDQGVALAVASSRASVLPGQGGLDVLRLDATYVADVAVEHGTIEFEDRNYEGHAGWREVTAAGVDGVRLEDSDVPATSVTDGLRSYPEDLLSSPLDVRSASATFALGTSAVARARAGDDATTSRPDLIGGAFADLIDRTGPLMVLALLFAFAFGALHALGPGHGKTLMAAYLVGSGGRVRHAVAVGGAVATMHTASVLALGFVVVGATSVFAPERVYPWLGLASGLIALALGATLLVSRLARWSDTASPDTHAHHDDERRAHGHHTHVHEVGDAAILSRKGLVALAVAGGVLPSPTALVVLLASVAVHRVAYGLALIAAFSLGLATALVAVGVLALCARGVVERRLSHRMARLVPVLSAVAIVALGLVLTVNGVTQL